MTNENKTTHSPLPWRVTESIPWKIDRENWVKNIILDANEEYVTSIFHKEGKDVAEAIAALIVEAVNERDAREEYIAYLKHEVIPMLEKKLDALRGIVRQMLPCVDRVRDGVHSVAVMNGEPPEDNPRFRELVQIIIDAETALKEADDGQE